MRKLFHFFLAGVVAYALASLLFSCSEEADCSMTDNRGMIVCNVSQINPENNTAMKDTLDSLTVTAAGTDSIVANRLAQVTVFSLPLRYAVDSTELVFHYVKKVTDTVVIRHTNKPYFISMDCGYQMQQSITSIRYTHHNIDSIYIANPEANINGTKNLEIFY